MYVGVMTLLAATTTVHEQPMYIGNTSLTWGLGTVLGPIIGGSFSGSLAGWRWAFYIRVLNPLFKHALKVTMPAERIF
jgi:MFS family permease